MDNIVKTISQYLDLVSKSRNKGIEHTPYFRGHANKSWDLCPASARIFTSSQEFHSYAMAIKEYPELFRECKSRLEEFIILQHYGLPTCLLDITSNPLVALYFACLPDGNESDGCVFSIPKYNRSEKNTDLWIEWMLSLKVQTGEHFNSSFSFEKAVKILNINKEAYEFLFENLTEAQIVIPPINNDRIRAQAGAFLLSGFEVPDVKDYAVKYTEMVENKEYDIDEMRQILFRNFSKDSYLDKYSNAFNLLASIPYTSKSSILKELDMCGINEATLFPEPEHQMQYIKNKILSM